MNSPETKVAFRLGLVVNPHAGLGGPAGLKGSDSPNTRELAAERGVISQVPERVRACLEGLAKIPDDILVLTASGSMGMDYAPDNSHLRFECVYSSPAETRAEDTVRAATLIAQTGVDLLVFVGGDGTARDVYRAVGEKQSVLGLPAGVKMHSGVFAVTPSAVSQVVASLLRGRLVAARMAEVRDIDEAAFAQDRVVTKHFGEMLIPDDQLLVQSVKCSGLPDDDMMLEELSAFLMEEMDEDALYVLGSGGTLHHFKSCLGIESPTLLGVDVWFRGELVAGDVYEEQLYALVQAHDHCKLLLSVIGGQGIVLGRGNQQISPRVIRAIGLENLTLVATPRKIEALQGRPLQVDSGSEELDRALSGFQPVLCGYDDAILYEVRHTDTAGK